MNNLEFADIFIVKARENFMFLLMSTLLKMLRLKNLNPLIVNLITLQNYFMFVKLVRNLLSIHNTIQTFVHPFFSKDIYNVLIDKYIVWFLYRFGQYFPWNYNYTFIFFFFRKENIALNSCFQYYCTDQYKCCLCK